MADHTDALHLRIQAAVKATLARKAQEAARTIERRQVFEAQKMEHWS
ncbi:hypothetical protein [Yoonia sp. R2-816]